MQNLKSDIIEIWKVFQRSHDVYFQFVQGLI